MRIPHKSQPPRHKVRQATQGVNHIAPQIGIKRVHGEIASRGILGHVLRKGHHGAPTIGVHIAPKSRYLMRHPARDHRHRAMLNPRWHHAQTRCFGQPGYGFRPGIGGNIDISHRNAQKRIADTTAYEQRPIPCRFQGPAQGLCAGLRQPVPRDPHRATRSASPRKMRAVAPQM